jgi:hypothetical protein
MSDPDPYFESEPADDDHADANSTSLSSLWARNGRVMTLTVGLTLAILSVRATVGWSDRQKPDAQGLMLVQLWIMSLLVPMAAYGADRSMDVLARAGITNDAFGLFVLVLGPATGSWGIVDAAQLYLLASAAGLFLTGLFVALQSARLPVAACSGLTAAVGLAVAIFHSVADRMPTDGSDLRERVNLLAAVGDALGARPGSTTWLVTLLIYAAAAGMCWSLPRKEHPL